MGLTILTQGSFTSTGLFTNINLPSNCDYFRTQNLTQLATTQSTGRAVMYEWYGNGLIAADSGIAWTKSNSSSNVMNATVVSSGGMTLYTTYPNVEAQASAAISGITAANPAVVSQTNTYNNGDVLRIYNTTGDLTIGGMDFQISSASGSGYTLLGLANVNGNGLAAATAGYTRRISAYNAMSPQFLYVTNISNATSAVVSTSVDPVNYYAVGMKVYFSVPSSFGMTQINGMTGTITAIDAVSASGNIGAYNFTVNINSSAFSAFTFPASALSPTAVLFATVAPAGASTTQNYVTGVQTGYNFTLQPFHTSQFTPFMRLDGGTQGPAGSSGDVIVWQASKMETTFYS